MGVMLHVLPPLGSGGAAKLVEVGGQEERGSLLLQLLEVLLQLEKAGVHLCTHTQAQHAHEHLPVHTLGLPSRFCAWAGALTAHHGSLRVGVAQEGKDDLHGLHQLVGELPEVVPARVRIST